ncbi:putative quinol monooxygenase [Pontiella sulfatireligans]|uniref:Putative quinol monooxygenase YgiN n=1 Tax=Pontiella sulfatireligans TaxID=2750658 RepID=A0A6C2URR5_9BACT|nr:putative quinol monooxygenase [Pontiella sulfatireligans]VGO21626.1 putative quinol monooxygenase YgiN [Pontiella sulfatireligans]
MEKLTIVATIKAKEAQVELVNSELLKLAEQTHAKDEGCINYNLHVDNAAPMLFVVYENWDSAELLQKHLDSAHFQAFMKATEGATEEFTVNEMTQIG